MNRRVIIPFILALIGTCGLEFQYLICDRKFIGGITLLPVFYITFMSYRKLFNIKKVFGDYVLAGILSFIYAGFFIFGIQFDILSEVRIPALTVLTIVLLFVEIFPFILLAFLWLDSYQIKPKENQIVLKKCFVILVIVWMISYFSLFPGIYATDAPYWYYEFSQKDIPISSQWSPLYCSLFYLFVRFGEIIFNSSNIGFAFFTFFQMLLSLYIVWKILNFFNRSLNEKFVIVGTAFFLLPIHVILALTSAQDGLFTVCFAMSVLYIIESILDEEKFWDSKKNIVKLIVWLFLMCTIRNNGLYAILFMMIILILIKKIRRIWFPLMTVLVLMLFYQGPIYNTIGIEKGTAIREMLSLPLQQMAYVYNYSERLTDQQRDEMCVYISDDGWKAYQPCISDQVKGQLNVDILNKRKMDFFRLYWECFVKDPGGYLQAIGLQTFGLWYPNKVWPDQRPWHPYIDILCYDIDGLYNMDFSINRKSLFPPYKWVLESLFGYGIPGDGYGGNLKMLFPRIPILNELCQIGTYTWILIFELFYAIYKRNKEILIILSLEFGLWLTVLLSPVVMYRYCAPFVFTAPLYTSLLFLLKNKREDEKKVLECKCLEN